jgi:translocation and assembly module TamB
MAIKGLPPDADPSPPVPVRPGSPPPAAAPGGPPRARRRWLRWLGVACLTPLFLALSGAAGIAFVASDLDRPWIKPRLVAFSHDQLGLDIDYEGLGLSLSQGLHARSFRVLSPPRLAGAAPEFLRVEDLAVRARLWTFIFGARQVDSLEVGRVEVTIVRDAAGNTTLSELFPPAPEPVSESPVRLSQVLRELPRLSIDVLEVREIGARLVELEASGGTRRSALSKLGVRGAFHSGDGLRGTQLRALGAPLRLDVSDGARTQMAQLPIDVSLGANDAESAALGVRVSLARQDFAPSWPWQGELLALDASLHADAGAGKTTLSVTPLRALGDALSLQAQADVFDHESQPLRVVASGKAHVGLEKLPVVIPGVVVDGLELNLDARELSWDGARVAGAVDFAGSLRRAALAADAGQASLAEVSLRGQGSFRPDGGQFQANLQAASLAAAGSGSSLDLAGIGLDLAGTTRELAGAQQLDADAVVAIAQTSLRAEGQVLGARGARWHTHASGSVADVSAQRVPALTTDVSVASLEARDAQRRTTLEQLRATARVDQLAVDPAAAFGVQGDAALTVSVPALRMFESGTKRSPALSVQDVELGAVLPLGAERAKGTLALGSLAAAGASLRELALDIELIEPLGWDPEHAGEARADVRGRLAGFDAGGGARGALESFQINLQEADGQRYQLALDATAARVTLAGLALPGRIVLGMRGDAAPRAGALALSSTLRGEGGAQLDLGIDGHFERQGERLEYTLDASAEKLEKFAALASEIDPRAGRVRLEGARLEAHAHGELAGVLVAGPGLLPVAASNPLATARGAQKASFALEGLDYRGPDRVLVVPKLSIELASTHRAANGGEASARLSLPTLRLEGGGTSLHLRGVEQKIAATFERAPDQGVVDVRLSLALAEVAQSWLPAYPVRDMLLSSSVQIDRLRSIFLRELVIDNPASGSKLKAAGTLELLANASQAGDKTIAGREALSFEGRFAQQLEPLERMQVASHAVGSFEVPFRLESGGLLGYRLIAALEAKAVSFASKDGTFAIEGLEGAIPVLEEFALLDSGPVISAGPRTSPLSDTRFFDVHPFLTGNDFVTARSIRLGGLAPLGPIAANVRLERSDFIIDQLQTGYQGGQIVGQVRVAYRDGDPIARLRLNATGVRSGKSQKVFDANMALSFVPRAMTLDGKVQIVRASREHLDDILDVLDPFHESANANRVRQGLSLGYPKFVRFQLHDGAVDTKVELGGIAQLVRIDEIRAVPLGPILQKYVAPAISPYLKPAAPRKPAEPSVVPEATVPNALGGGALGGESLEERASRVEP